MHNAGDDFLKKARKACAFTGHRPKKLPWGYNETDVRCVALKVALERQIRSLVQEGVMDFLSGMAEMWGKDNTKKVKNAASATENKRTGNVLQREQKASYALHRESFRKHFPSFRPQSTGLPRKHSIN